MKNLKKISSILILISTVLLTGCIEDKADGSDYYGYWKKVNYPNVILEITNEGNNKVVLAKTDLKERNRPVRKEPGSMKDGVLMYGDIYPLVIQQDGTLVYQGDSFVKQTYEEIAHNKKALATPQVHNDPFAK